MVLNPRGSRVSLLRHCVGFIPIDAKIYASFNGVVGLSGNVVRQVVITIKIVVGEHQPKKLLKSIMTKPWTLQHKLQ